MNPVQGFDGLTLLNITDDEFREDLVILYPQAGSFPASLDGVLSDASALKMSRFRVIGVHAFVADLTAVVSKLRIAGRSWSCQTVQARSA